MTSSPIEKVRRFDELTKRRAEIDGWLRHGRLGRKPGVIRRVGWLPGGYGMGWFTHDTFEELPREIYTAFFDTLSARRTALDTEIEVLRKELEES